MRFPGLMRPFALAAFVFAVSCGSSPAPTTPSPSPAPLHELMSATLAPATVTLASVSQTAQVVVTGTFNDGTTQDITTSTAISSSNDNVATVAQSGLVTAWGSGTATLTVTYQWPPPNSTPNPGFQAGQSLHATGAVTVLSGPPNNAVLVPTVHQSNERRGAAQRLPYAQLSGADVDVHVVTGAWSGLLPPSSRAPRLAVSRC